MQSTEGAVGPQSGSAGRHTVCRMSRRGCSSAGASGPDAISGIGQPARCQQVDLSRLDAATQGRHPKGAGGSQDIVSAQPEEGSLWLDSCAVPRRAARASFQMFRLEQWRPNAPMCLRQ